MPKPGETIHAIEHFTAGGGKGANQAVAAKRSGAETYFIGAVGNDGAGAMMTDLMSQDEINLTGVTTLEKTATGQAFIMVDNAGENTQEPITPLRQNKSRNIKKLLKKVIL